MNKIYNRDLVNIDLNLKTKRCRRWHNWLSLCVMFLIGTSAFAQVSSYTFSQTEGTYESIVEDGVLVSGSEATNTLTNDGAGWAVTIPFSFNFNSSNYTSIYVNSNGGATFGATTSTGSTLISTSTAYSGAISVMNRDLWGLFVTSGVTTSGSNVITNVGSFRGMAVGKLLNPVNGIPASTTVTDFDEDAQTITMSNNATSSSAVAVIRYGTGKVLTKVEGDSPNRIFTIQWEGYNDYGTTTSASNYLSFQLKLTETSNTIKIVYGDYFNVNTTSRTNQIGLRGATNSDYNNRTGSAGNPWTSTAIGTTNSSSVARDNVNYPASGLTFTWTPLVLVPCETPEATPTDLVFGTTSTTAINGSFTAASPVPTKYLVVRSTSDTAPTPVDGTVYTVGSTTLGADTNVRLASNALAFSDSGLTAETNYYYYVFSYNDLCTGAPFYNTTPLSGSQYTRCATGTTLAFNSITTNSANLTWTGSGEYIVEYGLTGFTPGTGSDAGIGGTIASSNATSPFELSGLEGSSSYRVYVRQVCTISGYSLNSTAGTLNTLCEALIAPTSVQDFETFSGTAPAPACWTEATGTLASNSILSGTTSAWLLKSNGFANVSNTNKGFSINLYSTKNEWMISPEIDLGPIPGLYRLKYRYAVTSYNGTGVVSTLSSHKVNVIISTDGGTTWSNANSIKTYTGVGTYSNTGVFETIDLTAYSGIVKIAFVASTTLTTPDIDFHVDDFSVEEVPVLPPNCATAFLPANLATGINRNSTLSWTEANGNPASYDVYFGTTSNPPFVVNTTSTNYTPITLANTTYFWKVVPKNLNGDASGCTEQSFTTGTNFTYCATSYANGPGTVDGVVNVTLGSLNNNSGNNAVSPFYTFFDSVTIPNIFVGETAQVSITFGTDATQFGGAWIDFNNDGVFDASEGKVSTIDADASGTTVLTFNVPTDAVKGNVRMRVRGGEDSALTTSQACGASSSAYGETEDYIVNITCAPGIWTGAVNTSWTEAGNWCDNTVPAAPTNVTVNVSNSLDISSSVEIASISLGSTANVTVNGTLNVGNITIAEGGIMTVANDAAILQTNGATNIGLVTVKRNSTDLFRQDYTLWSSPVAGQNLRAFSPQTLFNRFSSYDTAAGTIGAYLQEIVTTADMNTKTFTNAKGYLIRMPNNWVEIGGSAQPYLGSFKGTLNNGAVSIPLSGANNKLNLVGNPYASPISISTFFAANTNIDQTLYFWRKKASATPGNNASGYATYTSLGIVSADASINGTTPTNIEVGQGFFVIANSVTPGNLVFNNTMRNNGAATFYKSSNDNTAELHRFWLNLSNATNVVGQTLIGYKTGATQGIDAGVDALYFNDSATALTSLIDNSEYIIQGRNVPFVDTDIVPLGFKSDVAGSFTIGLSNFDGLFAENQAIYLKDNVSGTLHNLKLSDYTFTTSIGVFNNRFEVQYSSTLGTNNPELAGNTILIGVKDQKININAGRITMDKIELIDVAGRVIYTQEGVNATTTSLENVGSSNQMLIVRISTKENGVVNKKIIF